MVRRANEMQAQFCSKVVSLPQTICANLMAMAVHLSPEWEAKLNEMAVTTGREAADLLQDAMAGYFEELTHLRHELDSRYDDFKNGKVQPVDGEEVFVRLHAKIDARRSGK